MKPQYTFDPNIDWYYAEDNGLVFTSGTKIVNEIYVIKSHAAAVLLIEELKARIAELEATEPLPEPPVKRVVAIGKGDAVTAYDGAAFQDIAAEVMPGWRPA